MYFTTLRRPFSPVVSQSNMTTKSRVWWQTPRETTAFSGQNKRFPLNFVLNSRTNCMWTPLQNHVDSDIFRPSKVIKSCCEGWAGGIYIYYIALIILYTPKQYDTSLAWNSTETELMGSSITSRASLAEMRIFVPNISGMTSTTCRSRRVLAGQN